MKQLIFILLLISSTVQAQELKPADNEAIINLILTDANGLALQTEIVFKSATNTYTFQSNAQGKAEFIVQINQEYRIKIPNSVDYYNYEISDFSGQIFKLPLRFEISDDLQDFATDEQALLVLSVFNLPKGKEIEIIDEKTKSIYLTSNKDSLKTILPINSNYRLRIKGYSIENELIVVDETPLNIMYYVLYISGINTAKLIKSNNQAFLNVRYTNIHTKEAAPDEVVLVESKLKKKIYKGKTGKNGSCLFIVPKNDTYFVHISSAKNVLTSKINNGDVLSLYDFDILYPSTKEILANRKEDSMRLAIREGDYEERMKAQMCYDKNKLKIEIEKETRIVKKKLKENPNYFQESNNTVSRVMFRIRKIYKQKIIVTDLTSSMYPYMKQLLLWHSLKMMTDDKNEYVFFNDGDWKSDDEKVIGSIGGIYYTDSDKSEIVIDKMLETMQNGIGGTDFPENDIEALIYAQNKKNSRAEILLIADNYSSVKDISLLTQLNVPIRIILCGTEWGIHPDYLEIAYKTNGSIHTIEEDIMKLEKMTDGKALKIGKYSFVYSNGKFFKVK